MHEYLFLCCYPCFVGCRYKNRVTPCCKTSSSNNVKEDVIKITKIKERGQTFQMTSTGRVQVQDGKNFHMWLNIFNFILQ